MNKSLGGEANNHLRAGAPPALFQISFWTRNMNIRQILEQSPRSQHRELRVEGLGRTYILHVPETLRCTAEGRFVALVNCDSWAADERHGGPIVNGLNEVCDQYGVIGVYPYPYPQWGGLWRGWNTPDGALRYNKRWDDVLFISDLLDSLESEVGALNFIAAGFSNGGMFVQNVDLRLPGRLKGVVSVNGTIDPALPLPTPGSRIVVIHGVENPKVKDPKKRGGDRMLPYRGGVGTSLRAKFECRLLGGARAHESRPDLQARRYAEANYVLGQRWEDEHPGFTRVVYGWDEPAFAVEYLVHGGGHAWYGRKTGKGMESPFSRLNASLMPTVFSVNDTIVREAGLNRLV